MSRTLAQMRNDVRNLLNEHDTDSFAAFSNDEVDLAIDRAASLVASQLASEGGQNLRQTMEVSYSNSVATIIPVDRILAVFFKSGDSVYRIKRGNPSGRQLPAAPSDGTLIIDYIAKHTPVADGYNITYAGVDLDDPVFDQYVAYLAASDLTAKDASPNPVVERKLQVLENAVKGKGQLILTSDMPSYGLGMYDGLRWSQFNPTTLKIFR